MTQITIRYDDNGIKLKLDKLTEAIETLPVQEADALFEEAKYDVSGGYSGGSSYQVPTLTGQSYQRTGNLGRSVFWVRDGLSYRMKVEAYSVTGQEYGASVLGRADGSGQAFAFVGRWPNFLATMEKWADILIERTRKRINDAAEAIFGASYGI